VEEVFFCVQKCEDCRKKQRFPQHPSTVFALKNDYNVPHKEPYNVHPWSLKEVEKSPGRWYTEFT